MKFLIIGLGSMGKRRIRCLKELGFNDIYGIDVRIERCNEVRELYEIETVHLENQGNIFEKVDAYIISVPPDLHHIYMKKAIEYGKHFFVEASVVDTDMTEIIKAIKDINIVAAPSATMQFHPAVQKIKTLINNSELGSVSNFFYQSGQYLPDWHTYENVSDFYVSKKETGGAREIVPFELTWLTDIFGWPTKVSGQVKKTIDIVGAETIDDTYNILLDFDNYSGVLTVDVVSRFATRRLLINGSKKQLIWDWNKNVIEIYDPELKVWDVMNYDSGKAENGYNENLGETMYIDEIKTFIDAINKGSSFINTLDKDYEVLQLLYAIESSSQNDKAVEV